MAIGPIGNAIFANQMTANVASVQNSHTNRVDMQNLIAQASVNEKDEKVLEVRPTEENHEVDPDTEHQKDETEKKDQKDEKEDSEETLPPSIHKLDIKV